MENQYPFCCMFTGRDDTLIRHRRVNVMLREQRIRTLGQWIREDPDPKKSNAMRQWRDDVVSRLRPPRDIPDRMPEQLARLPLQLAPFAVTWDRRVLFGPQNEVWAIMCDEDGRYIKVYKLVPPQELEHEVVPHCYIAHHSE